MASECQKLHCLGSWFYKIFPGEDYASELPYREPPSAVHTKKPGFF